ncbi:hypothetical protein HY490_00155 [Candidatus Woesearchaeota archaeon]|nr:hypothetical protein [Candidatus Woesearchaeota archaeon]
MRWLFALFILPMAVALDVAIVPDELTFVVPAGGYVAHTMYIQSAGGTPLHVEFSLSRSLVQYMHVVPESNSIYRMYTIIPKSTPEQTLLGTLVVQLTADNNAITSADVRTIQKKIPVIIKVEGQLSSPATPPVHQKEEPIIPLSFNTLPLAFLIIIMVVIANAALRRRL